MGNIKFESVSEMTKAERKEKKYGLDFRKSYIVDMGKWETKAAFGKQSAMFKNL